MARIENHKFSIQESFQECFYIVPDYQREYVWTDKEVNQLLDDINEQIDGGHEREYFIGTILVSPTAQKNHFEVIDGQQRLPALRSSIFCRTRPPPSCSINGLPTTRWHLMTSIRIDWEIWHCWKSRST